MKSTNLARGSPRLMKGVSPNYSANGHREPATTAIGANFHSMLITIGVNKTIGSGASALLSTTS